MPTNVNDTYGPISTFQTPQEYAVLFLFISHLSFCLYLFYKCIFYKALDLYSKVGKFALVTLSILIIWQIFNICLMYIECSKLVSLLSAIVATHLSLAGALGMMELLKSFSVGSKFLSVRRILFMQIGFCMIHFTLIGPYYYLLGYVNGPNPMKIGVLWF